MKVTNKDGGAEDVTGRKLKRLSSRHVVRLSCRTCNTHSVISLGAYRKLKSSKCSKCGKPLTVDV